MVATPGNSENITSAGLVKFDGTNTFTGVTTTANNVLVGAASNSIANVAPSSTSGVPLISQGSSSNPAFGTAVVAGGGSGATSFNTNGVLISNTSSTGALAALSLTSGQLVIGGTSTPAAATLTAGTGISITNGNNSITINSTASSFSPNSTIQIFDDFIGAVSQSSSGFVLSQQCYVTGSAAANWTSIPGASQVNTNPGVIGNASFTSGEIVIIAAGANTTAHDQIVLGGGALNLNWVINVATLSNSTNRYILEVGLIDSLTTTSNGVYFRYSDNINSGNWTLRTAAASSFTTVNTSTAVANGFVNLGMQINAAASSVSFTINGSSVGSAIVTNIPTNPVNPGCILTFSAGTIAANSVLLDLWYLTQTLTTPR